MILANKYRPKKFKDVLDQEDLILILKNIIREKNTDIPIMFTGPHGVGKTSLARIFSKSLLCKNITSDIEPCGECFSCKTFESEENVAYQEIDAATNSGVDAIRQIRENAEVRILGDYDKKVIVIDECHSISRQGNEALLKQLEDTKGYQVYVFCTTSPDSMHDPVRSRCFEFSLNFIKKESISKKLQEICSVEKISYKKEALDLISSLTAPHVRDAIKVLDYFSNLKEVCEDSVKKYFNLQYDIEYLSIIRNMKLSLSETILILDKLILNNQTHVIYEGLISNILKCLKLGLGIDEFRNDTERLLAKEILLYDYDLNLFLEELLKRNRYVNTLTLQSDIVLIYYKVNKSTRVVTPLSNPVLTPIEEPKKIISASPVSSSSFEDGTSKILERFKGYSNKHAMLIHKSKSNSNSFKVSKIEVPEFKKELSNIEIKNYIDSKKN